MGKKQIVKRCHLDISTLWSQAWMYTKANVRQFSSLIALIIIVYVINSGFDGQNKDAGPEMQVIISFLSLFLSLIASWLSIGLIQITLKLLEGGNTTFADGIIDFTRTGKALVANILSSIFSLLTAIPLIIVIIVSHDNIALLTNNESWFLFLAIILFLVPIIYVGIRLNYTSTVILDQNSSIWRAITGSRRITKNHVACLFVLNLVAATLQILGILTLGIGLFWTIPFMIFSQTIAYKMLRDHYGLCKV